MGAVKVPDLQSFPGFSLIWSHISLIYWVARIASFLLMELEHLKHHLVSNQVNIAVIFVVLIISISQRHTFVARVTLFKLCCVYCYFHVIILCKFIYFSYALIM